MNIEQLLTDNLRPVAAPPQLWARVALPAEHRRQSAGLGRSLAWCVTAALILLMAFWGFRARGAGYPPVLAKAPHCVEFLNARVVGDGSQMIEVSWRVGAVVASLRAPQSPELTAARLSFSGGDSRACLSCHLALN
jgi:hypothetical protein